MIKIKKFERLCYNYGKIMLEGETYIIPQSV